MINKRILILGGYGSTGKPIAEGLLQETNVHLILAGRNSAKAETLAAALNAQNPGNRVTGAYADAYKPSTLRPLFAKVDMVLVASSTAAYVKEVAGEALSTGIDYFDVQVSSEKIAVLKSMAGQIEAAGCCFITDGGFHPGLPAALIHYCAPTFDHLKSANVASVIKIDWAALDIGQATMDEFVGDMMNIDTLAYRDGQWQKTGWLAMMVPNYVEFSHGFGRQYALPMFLEEMRAIPDKYPGIENTGFFVGGFNWFVDWLVMPIAMAALTLSPKRALRPMARLTYWGLKKFSKPPFGTLLKLEARGIKDNRERAMNITLFHEDGYAFTAIPVVACLSQVLDGAIRKPGLWLQADIVEPGRFLHDMEQMGIDVDCQEQFMKRGEGH